MDMQTIKNGTTVEWTSQAGGAERTKKGTVITVLKKNQDYTSGNRLPQRLFVDIMREDMGYSRDRARKLHSSGYYGLLLSILQRRYKVKFNLAEGMYRDEEHYLIEVEDNDRKPFLYHPRAGETFIIVK
jgi:hypothetical protein